MKKFIMPTIVGFIFIFIYEQVVHGLLLGSVYVQTPTLWRSVEGMQAMIPLTLLFQFLMTAVMVVIFSKGYENKGVAEGIRFGVLFGVLKGLSMSYAYVYMPISLTLGVAWFFAGFFQMLGLGIVIALMYKT